MPLIVAEDGGLTMRFDRNTDPYTITFFTIEKDSSMDQENSEHLEIEAEDRFRSGAHLDGLVHENPPLVPPGVTPTATTEEAK